MFRTHLGHVRLASGHEHSASADEVGHLLERDGVEPGRAVRERGVRVVLAHHPVERVVEVGADAFKLFRVDRVVVQPVVLQERRLLRAPELPEAVPEQRALLREEPPSKLLGPAVREPQREVRDFVLPRLLVLQVKRSARQELVLLRDQELHLRGLLPSREPVVDRFQHAHALERVELELLERHLLRRRVRVHGEVRPQRGRGFVRSRAPGGAAALAEGGERRGLGLVLLPAEFERHDACPSLERLDGGSCERAGRVRISVLARAKFLQLLNFEKPRSCITCGYGLLLSHQLYE